ncbi:hypothetical protein I3F84_005220 [Salmonella enterica]|nr:hypothetical protein [Salmonella enterica]HCM1891756.1 hypothetical protein [Salmonella enterica subsp. diarizonae serovar 57:c:e,n,x,z15]EGQ5168590.1 hypothetical protein [Salmonella enterica]EKA4657493.1 hypothetical protein [Salmonella enterica]EKA4660857.1 hypothetical protein [Salmonella enterica]
MKLSHKDLSTFLTTINSYKKEQNQNVADLPKLRLSKADIKFIDKEVAKYIKNDQRISFADLTILNSLHDIIKKQGSHCESEKLAKLSKALKNVTQIKSDACLASERMEKHFSSIKDATQKHVNLMPVYKESMLKLNEKIKDIDIAHSQITTKQKDECLNAKTASSKYILLTNISTSLMRKETVIVKDTGRWGRSTERNIVKVKYLKGYNLWHSCARDAQKAMAIEGKIKKLNQQLSASRNQIRLDSSRFKVPSNEAGLAQLKNMV